MAIRIVVKGDCGGGGGGQIRASKLWILSAHKGWGGKGVGLSEYKTLYLASMSVRIVYRHTDDDTDGKDSFVFNGWSTEYFKWIYNAVHRPSLPLHLNGLISALRPTKGSIFISFKLSVDILGALRSLSSVLLITTHFLCLTFMLYFSGEGRDGSFCPSTYFTPSSLPLSSTHFLSFPQFIFLSLSVQTSFFPFPLFPLHLYKKT